MIILLIYVAIFLVAFLVVRFIASRMHHIADFMSRKTVTFGDASAVQADRAGQLEPGGSHESEADHPDSRW